MSKSDSTRGSQTASRQETEREAGIQPTALKELYDGIYGEHVEREHQCPVSTGNLVKARKRVRQVLEGFGLFSKSRSMQVLDIGCGFGFTSQAFHELGAKVTAIDLSPIALARAEKMFAGVDFRCVVFPEGLTEGEAFDLIWAVDLPLVGIFESERIRQQFLKPCLKLLKVNGHLIVGWHTDFSGRQSHGWINWSFRTIRELRKTLRASWALIPQLRFFWLSAFVCHLCRLARYSAPVYFHVKASDWREGVLE